MADGKINVVKVFDAEEVAASGSATSNALSLNLYKPDGYFSVQVEITGDGTATLSYTLSNNDKDYLVPTGASEIIAGLTKTSGPSGDGKNMYKFATGEPMLAKYIKFVLTETGTSETVTATVWLAMA